MKEIGDSQLVKPCSMPIIIERKREAEPQPKTQFEILNEAAHKNGLQCVSIVNTYEGRRRQAPGIGKRNLIIRGWLVGYRTVASVSSDGLTLTMETFNEKMFCRVIETAKEFEKRYGKKMTIIK